jgi:hypothetical protein
VADLELLILKLILMSIESTEHQDSTNPPLLIVDVISRFFKDKAKEHGVNEANLFIENRITYLSLCVFTEFESRVLEERINGL